MTEIKRNSIVVAGGTGFLGQGLAKRLEEIGRPVVVLGRHKPKGRCYGRWVYWDGRTVGGWAGELDRASAVVNLAGRTVDCRKTPDRCDEILRSRVDSVNVIGEALRTCGDPPTVWVQAATAHIYGDPPGAVCDESAEFGFGLAPFVGQRWEAALDAACPPEVRSVVLRTSFVLGNTGGAFPVLRRLARLGLGGKIGNGKQWISWLHIGDMVRILMRAIDEPGMSGVYNVTAPQAVTNADFMRRLRQAVGVPIGLPSPGWLVRLGAATLVDTDPELPLYGRNVVPKRLLDEGFVFEHPDLDAALRDLVGV
ncbi:MAG: TIGR01777 family oxidoreductase [Phycisphaeraceae bacterium]|nr:TIGR01777 family oxidoreductase [Phycisphaeraceae bacterium]